MTQSVLHRRNVILSAFAGAASLPLALSAKAEATTQASVMSDWMSWQGGVDLVGLTNAGLSQPNLIVHLARVVHTPVGSAPAGMVLYQPEATQPPLVMGFVSSDPKVGAYFGPHIFKGTPFEAAPVLKARIAIDESAAPGRVSSKISVGKHVFEVTLEGLSDLSLVDRPVGALPFVQQGLESVASQVSLKIDGKTVSVIVPPQGMSGGPAAVWSPTGLYAR
ncbi:hypothetical protein [Asticcacaulis sp. AC402]|uniref:hypothetical protein n=1 Tax=Asticcacaulis sp. AC402 TaxID=1282361 RepID=UPI0003C3C538|nr:hypothetical protein [Asticcacaulis sp. AC402]ESQ77115.1 hypothetical protein ABAC402_01580 [Asticcacaulis sp. AC402]